MSNTKKMEIQLKRCGFRKGTLSIIQEFLRAIICSHGKSGLHLRLKLLGVSQHLHKKELALIAHECALIDEMYPF